MLDKKTLAFLNYLRSHKDWVCRSELVENGFSYDRFWLDHLKSLNYIDCSVHLEEQYRITPVGESAIIEHNRAKRSDLKSTIAIIISVIALIISFLSYLDEARASKEKEPETPQTITAQYH